MNAAQARKAKSRLIYFLLGVSCGNTGLHNFFAGYYIRGAVHLAILVLCWNLWLVLFVQAAVVLTEALTVRRSADGELMHWWRKPKAV